MQIQNLQRISGTSASLYVKTNLGDLIWPGFSLQTGAANENFVWASIIVPANATSISLGVKWNGTGYGDTVYINKVSLYKNDFEYNYFIEDQVGSTRVVLQTNPGTQVYTATFEPQNQSNEQALFNSISSGTYNPGANTTPGGSYALKLVAASGGQVGVAKQLRVYPGDWVSATVNSWFLTGGSYSKTAVLGTVANTFSSLPINVVDGAAITYNVTNTSNAVIGLLSPDQGASKPSAFLNYILFDKDFKPISGKSVPVPAGGGGALSIPSFQVQELGYVFIYLSYDNSVGNDVYFDDLKITVQESNVIQVNNYYPFGMESYSWLRGGETNNVYMYQGKELIAQTGWHDFGSRMYYSDLGRWFATDPQNQFASPYLAIGNIPMMGTDPNGEKCRLCDWLSKKSSQKLLEEIVAVVVISIVTDGIASAWAPELETALGVSKGASLLISGSVMGAVGGATSGFAVGEISGHKGSALSDDIWQGAVSGLVGGLVDKEFDLAHLKGNKILLGAAKGATRGLAQGFTNGFVKGMSNHWSIGDDLKLGISEGLWGGGIGMVAGTLEGSLKGGEADEKLADRITDKAAKEGLKQAAKETGMTLRQIISKGFYEGNISGKLFGAMADSSNDTFLSDNGYDFKKFDHDLWGNYPK